MEIYTAVKYLRVNLHTGCVKQGKVMGLHTGCQLCQPVRMFPSVGRGRQAGICCAPRQYAWSTCGKVGKHNGMDVVKACHLTSWQETKLCHFAVLKKYILWGHCCRKGNCKTHKIHEVLCSQIG